MSDNKHPNQHGILLQDGCRFIPLPVDRFDPGAQFTVFQFASGMSAGVFVAYVADYPRQCPFESGLVNGPIFDWLESNAPGFMYTEEQIRDCFGKDDLAEIDAEGSHYPDCTSLDHGVWLYSTEWSMWDVEPVAIRVFLPYDFIAALADWHDGQSSPEYSVGSCFRANKCPENWDVSDLAYRDDVPGYWATLPRDYVLSLVRTAEKIEAYEAEDCDDPEEIDRRCDAAQEFLGWYA